MKGQKKTKRDWRKKEREREIERKERGENVDGGDLLIRSGCKVRRQSVKVRRPTATYRRALVLFLFYLFYFVVS